MCEVCETSDCDHDHKLDDNHAHDHSPGRSSVSMKTDSDFGSDEFDFIDKTKACKRERKFKYKEIYNEQVELFKAISQVDKTYLLSKIKDRIEDMASVYQAMSKPFSRRTPEDLEQISQAI